MSTIFTKIVNKEIPCHLIKEDDRFLAFLDVMPLVEGHVLVIPKQEVDYIFDLEPELLGDLMKFAQTIAPAIKKSITCKPYKKPAFRTSRFNVSKPSPFQMIF
jgi:histidine triad (HIT) family protein